MFSSAQTRCGLTDWLTTIFPLSQWKRGSAHLARPESTEIARCGARAVAHTVPLCFLERKHRSHLRSLQYSYEIISSSRTYIKTKRLAVPDTPLALSLRRIRAVPTPGTRRHVHELVEIVHVHVAAAPPFLSLVKHRRARMEKASVVAVLSLCVLGAAPRVAARPRRVRVHVLSLRRRLLASHLRGDVRRLSLRARPTPRIQPPRVSPRVSPACAAPRRTL